MLLFWWFQRTNMKQFFTLLFFFVQITTTNAQPPKFQRQPWHASVEVGAGAATGNVPFLLRTNQYGIVPTSERSFIAARFSLIRQYRVVDSSASQTKKSHFDWGMAISPVLNTRPGNVEVLWPDAFVKVKYRAVELYAGRRREVVGLGDTLLTSGFLIWSGNAPTLPKVQISTPNFVSIGWLKNILAFKVSFAHGWFTTPYVTDSYLHQKTLYVRLGKPNWKLKLFAGLNHQVQWGGRADYLLGTQKAVGGLLPQNFKDYTSLVLGRFPEEKRNDRFTEFDGTNRVGNHIGSIDAAVEWRGAKGSWLFYHQHPYEDASGVSFQNFPDGLTGLRFVNARKPAGAVSLRNLTFEVLNTMSQSGPVFDVTARFQGRDNYFNHGQYIAGWSFLNRTLGTPYIMPRSEVNPALLVRTEGIFFPNNRTQVFYVAAAFQLWRTAILQLRGSQGFNHGSHNVQYNPVVKQFSTSFVLNVALPFLNTTHLLLSGGYDGAGLLAATTGGYVGIKKSW